MMQLAVNRTLLHLNLAHNYLTDEGVIAIASAVARGNTLQTLKLDYNGFGFVGAQALGHMLGSNTSLSLLSLLGNSIGPDGLVAFSDGLALNTSLRTLHLEDGSHCQPRRRLGSKDLAQFGRVVAEMNRGMSDPSLRRHLDRLLPQMPTSLVRLVDAYAPERSAVLVWYGRDAGRPCRDPEREEAERKYRALGKKRFDALWYTCVGMGAVAGLYYASWRTRAAMCTLAAGGFAWFINEMSRAG